MGDLNTEQALFVFLVAVIAATTWLFLAVKSAGKIKQITPEQIKKQIPQLPGWACAFLSWFFFRKGFVGACFLAIVAMFTCLGGIFFEGPLTIIIRTVAKILFGTVRFSKL